MDVLFGNASRWVSPRSRARAPEHRRRRNDLTNQIDMTRGGDYPQAWWRTFGKGRTFYTALGHRDDIWSNDPVFRAHVLGGIRWALNLEN
jgi:type 1 glutamine amidotransferase